MIRTIPELKKHIEAYGNVAVIIGPYVDDYAHITKEEGKTLTLRTLVEDTQTFYSKFFEKIYNIVPSFTAHLLEALPFEATFIAQSTSRAYLPLDPYYLKGCDYNFNCSVCKTSYSKEDVDAQKALCSCGKKIRPNILLSKEKYDIRSLKDFDSLVEKSNTIFLVGFDFNEEELVSALYLQSIKKMNATGPVVFVCIGECDQKSLFEEFKFDFIVNENPKTALVRFLDLYGR